MNTLVGLGATAAFAISSVAALLPGLGWRTFFEEPAMLLGVVLLGRWDLRLLSQGLSISDPTQLIGPSQTQLLSQWITLQ